MLSSVLNFRTEAYGASRGRCEAFLAGGDIFIGAQLDCMLNEC